MGGGEGDIAPDAFPAEAKARRGEAYRLEEGIRTLRVQVDCANRLFNSLQGTRVLTVEEVILPVSPRQVRK
eukprot:6199901-Pleurochrysis_carterae.AAC.2